MIFHNFLRSAFFYSHRYALPFRYKLTQMGFEDIKKDPNYNPNYGMLLLVNHTTPLDPLFVLITIIHKIGNVHIWASDFVAKILYVRLFANYCKWASYIWVPTKPKNETLTPEKEAEHKKRLEALYQESISCILAKENVLIHPSGRSKTTPQELLGRTNGAHVFLQRCPEANVVLVRHSGLWGSRFSRAYKRNPKWKNESDRWRSILGRVALMVLANGIFFMPKRHLTIEYRLAPPDFPRNGSVEEVNAYLEKFYNEQWGPGGELLQEVPDFFWQKAGKSVFDPTYVTKH